MTMVCWLLASLVTVTFCSLVVFSLPFASALALDRVHHVSLLREHRVAELLRPVEIVVHHGEHRRRRHKRLDARVPILLRKRFVELVALERFIGLRSAVSPHNF